MKAANIAGPAIAVGVPAGRVESGELTSIDIARGIAAMSVFVYHYGIGHVLAMRTGFSQFEWIAVPGAVYAVPFFFIISGFCIHRAEWRRALRQEKPALDIRAYLRRRFFRIYPAYIFALFLSCFVNFAVGIGTMPMDLVVHALLLQGFSSEYFNSINLVLWTISVEFFLYLIYPAWFAMRRRAGIVPAVVAGTIVSIASLLLSWCFFYPYSAPVMWFFLSTWGGWLFGAMLSEFELETSGRDVLGRWWWQLGFASWAAFLISDHAGVFGERYGIFQIPLRIYLCAWAMTALLLMESRFRSATGAFRWLVWAGSWCGACSYSIYLLHEPLITVRNIVQSLDLSGDARAVLQIGWFFVILYLCGKSYRYIERRFASIGR
jgi:peptidoglycan/LPS O-acetylase OafA/YrhL